MLLTRRGWAMPVELLRLFPPGPHRLFSYTATRPAVKVGAPRPSPRMPEPWEVFLPCCLALAMLARHGPSVAQPQQELLPHDKPILDSLETKY